MIWKLIRRIVLAVCALAIALRVIGAFTSRWSSFVYPDRADLSRSISAGDFPTLDECRDASEAVLRRIPGAIEKGTFECGKNCEYRSDIDFNVCEETIR